MSDFKHKTNSGSLFKNDRKEKDTHPDYRGTINVDGREWEISAWLKDGAKGKFMSLAVKEPYQATVRKAEREAWGVSGNDLDDGAEIPF